MQRVLLAVLVFVVGASEPAWAALTISSTLNPSGAGSLCGLGVDSTSGDVWVYACSGTDVQRYSPAGVFQSSVTRPGESANDVDVELAPEAFTLNATSLPAGSLLFINGETSVADVYAVDKVGGAGLATLNTAFGVSHVVGGGYHPGRNSLFLIQDMVPAAADENRIAELNTGTGSVVNTFQITPTFSVNFGDLDVCGTTGNLLVVSSDETSIAEYSPIGAFIQHHALPVGVSLLSGIGIDDPTGDIWVANTNGIVWRLAGGPCDPPANVPTLPQLARLALALLLLGWVVAVLRAKLVEPAR